MKTKLVLLFTLAFTGLFAQKDNTSLKYAETIKAEDLSKHLHVLASDSFEGRETGEKGQKLAAQYISTFYQSIGIPPVEALNGYYQKFPLVIQAPAGVKIVNNSNEYVFLKDFYYFPGFSDQLIKANEITFLGYGIADPKYDDYKDADVNDKVLMILEGEPGKKTNLISGTKEPSQWNTWRRKNEIAKEKGVKVLLVVVEDINRNIQKSKHSIENPTMRIENGPKRDKTIPIFYISMKMANEIMGKKIESIKKQIDKSSKPVQFKTATELTIDVNRETQNITAENVLGYIEGTDKKDELIIITAHYDHLGKHDNVVYAGADDDGSGTVAVMELAQAFIEAKKQGNGPRRSMLFMPVAGEEKGLLGSEYYTEHPVFPLKNTVADLNIDMIGRLDKKHEGNPNYIYLIGSDKLSKALHEINETANKTYTQLELDYTYNDPKDPNRFYYRSDHYNFVKNNIPVIFYFNGVHEDYHQASDTVDKIDFKKMEKITRLVFHTAWELANRPERITVDVKAK